METTHDAAAKPGRLPSNRRRGILAGLALVLACLSILLATVAVWTHQVAFDTARFTALVEPVVGDPAVIAPVSARISSQVTTALDVEGRIANRLPDAAKGLAGPLTAALREGIDKRLQEALANPRLQAGLLQALSLSHSQVMRLLREDRPNINVVDGYVTIDAFPVVGAALTELQSIGIIPAGVQLPDLSASEAPNVIAPRLAAALGVTLPPDFGTIRLMPADRLLAARSLVRAFDIVVIALIVLTIMLIGLTLWLARDRRRMVLYLAIGTIIVFALARFAIRGAEGVLVGGIDDVDVQGASRVVLDAALADLRRVASIILVATAVVAVIAYLSGRPAWLTRLSSRGRGSDGAIDDGAPMGAVGSDAEASIPVERLGLAAIAFALVWLALGLEVALLGAALVVGFELVLGAVNGRRGDGDVATATSDPPATTGGTVG